MIRYIDQATCDRWDELLATIDPTEHAGGASNPYRPGWYWFDQGNPRGPFETYKDALIDRAHELDTLDALIAAAMELNTLDTGEPFEPVKTPIGTIREDKP